MTKNIRKMIMLENEKLQKDRKGKKSQKCKEIKGK